MPEGRDTIILLTSVGGELRDAVADSLTVDGASLQIVETLNELGSATGDLLVSFGTSVIVPPDVLERFEGRAFNVHAASPDYPGRDPHHFAIYDGVSRYGATLHVMTAKVDDGSIVDVEWFDVPAACTPGQLLDLANDASVRLLKRYGLRLLKGQRASPIMEFRWGTRKRSRADFRAMCELRPDMTEDEFERRFRAFDGGTYDNLTVQIHGWTFRIDKLRGRKP